MEYYVTSMFEKSLNVYYCGLDQTRPKHSCGPAMRSHFLLTYVLKGKGVFRTEGTTFHLEAGTSFVMFPGVVGYYQADSEDPWEYAWVGFGGDAAKTYVEEIGLSQKLPILHHLDRDWMSNWFQLLFEQAAQKTMQSDIRSISLLYALLAEIIGSISLNSPIEMPLPNAGINQKNMYMKKSIRFIETNYSKKTLSVSMIASHLGLDRSYFTKLFSSHFSKTPHQFLLEYRMEQASRILSHTDMSVRIVAESVGFDDPVYFSKIYHKLCGMSPSTFRKGTSIS